MAINIDTELAAIMEAVFGEDVRGSIHDALQKMATATNEAIAIHIDRSEVSKLFSLNVANYTEVAANTDFNAYVGTPANYVVPSVAVAQSTSHIPVQIPGRLYVFPGKTGTNITAFQLYITSWSGNEVAIYLRGFDGSSWTSWKNISSDASRLLSLDVNAYKEVAANTNFDAYVGTPANYIIPTVAIAQSTSNIPVQVPGRLYVFPGKSGTNIETFQVYITTWDANQFNIYMRGYDGLGWTTWKNISDYSIAKHWEQNNSVWSIAHRGYSNIAPENTVPAFVLAKRYGFNAVECDLNYTSDNVPVLLHDDTINRTAYTSDGISMANMPAVNISSITHAESGTYDFGRWKGTRFIGVPIMSLERMIVVARDLGLHVFIDIKENVLTDTRAAVLMEMIGAYRMLDNVTWLSFDANDLRTVQRAYPKATLGLLWGTLTADVIQVAQSLKTDENTVYVDSSDYSDNAVALCRTARLPLMTWTVNDETVMKNLSPYICGVTSDKYVYSKVLYDKSMAYARRN